MVDLTELKPGCPESDGPYIHIYSLENGIKNTESFFTLESLDVCWSVNTELRLLF